MIKSFVLLGAASLVAGLAGAGSASATTVCLSAGFGGTSYGPDASCSTTETELGVTLTEAHNTMTGAGSIDGLTTGLDFSSTVGLDYASGASTIKTPGGGSFGDLTIATQPGFTFDDLIFHVQMDKTGTGNSEVENLTVTWGTGANDSYTYTTLKPNTDLDFFLVASSPITSVSLSSTTGIDEVKQFSISSVAAIPRVLDLGDAGAWLRRSRLRGLSLVPQGRRAFCLNAPLGEAQSLLNTSEVTPPGFLTREIPARSFPS